jgi:hypothetical protein
MNVSKTCFSAMNEISPDPCPFHVDPPEMELNPGECSCESK